MASSSAQDAVEQLRRHVQEKVEQKQRGIRTFADRWFLDLLATADKHSGAADHDRLEAVQHIEQIVARWNAGRFATFAARDSATLGKQHRSLSDIPAKVLAESQGERECLNWRGLALFKTVWDLAIYPLLLAELRPASILELGSGAGGSALWLADTARALGLELHVHSVDIQVPTDAAHPHVTFWHGDLEIPEDSLGPHIASRLGRPLVIIEDAHVNTLAVLNRCAEIMTAGDYLVVEDSWFKRPALRAFTESAQNYLVDTRYTDFFGYNATCAQDSVLKRVPETGRIS